MKTALNESVMGSKGISKNEAHVALQQLSRQLILIDHQLTENVAKAVMLHFQDEQSQVTNTKNHIKKMIN